MSTQLTLDQGLLPINMLWIGGRLGAIEQLSALSFMRAGHRVRLHTYEHVNDVPPGVELVDASLTVSRQRMEELRYRGRSYALSSDYFRYALQAKGEGFWADLDLICLKPIEAKEAVFGLESHDSINVAILYLSMHLPVVEELIDIFKDNFIPPWVDEKIARKRRLKRWLPGRKIRPAIMPWATYGPRALTHLAKKHDLFTLAAPIPVYYPLAYENAPRSFDSSFSFESVIQETTRTIHLWNDRLGKVGLRGTKPPQGSPLDKLFKEYGL